jgi:hypothetical protein
MRPPIIVMIDIEGSLRLVEHFAYMDAWSFILVVFQELFKNILKNL